MNPLQYTSEEMFSSTELIRKSKKVFDKLQRDEIEKAIILRDGKPAFMLLDFFKYEKMMSEYLSLKELLETKTDKVIQEKEPIDEEIYIEKESSKIDKISELNEKDLEEALAEIENLNLDEINNLSPVDEKEPLKEFWEK